MTINFDVSTPTHPGLVAMIDECDRHLVFDGGPRWVAMKGKQTFYVVRGLGGRKNRTFQYLHRVILGITDRRTQGDHQNGNGLDNTRGNLRAATNQQNSRNRRPLRGRSSSYLGVSWDAERSKWTAGIRRNGKKVSLGRFDTEEKAAKAYDQAAIAEYGEFARPNFQVTP